MERLGYGHYEVSNFAFPGMESLHNKCYWEGGEYVGVGPGAHSYTGGKRYANAPTLSEYLSEGRLRPDKIRIYDARDSCAEETELIMLGLRTSRGIPLVSVRCGETAVRDIVDGGLARIDGDRLVLSNRGFLVMNDVVLRLMAGEAGIIARGGTPRIYW